MKLRNPILIKTAGLLGAVFVKRLMATLDMRLDFSGGEPHPPNPRDKRFIYALWHDQMLGPTFFRTRAKILISRHADGEIIAQIVRHLGFGVVRGSTTRGGAEALLGLREAAKDSHLVVTPDGPRGPRHVAQAGVVSLAAHTGLPIVPIAVDFTRAWRAPSWDRLAIPMPFSQMIGIAGPAIHVPPTVNTRNLQPYLALVQQQLDALNAEAQRRAKREPRTPPEIKTPPLAKSA